MMNETAKAYSVLVDAEKQGFHVDDNQKRFILRYAFFSENPEEVENYIRKISGMVKTNADLLESETKRIQQEIWEKQNAIGIVIDTIEATEEILAFAKETLKEGKEYLEKAGLLDEFENVKKKDLGQKTYLLRLKEKMQEKKEEEEERTLQDGRYR